MQAELSKQFFRITLIAGRNSYDEGDIDAMLCEILGQEEPTTPDLDNITAEHLSSLERRVSTPKFSSIESSLGAMSLLGAAESSDLESTKLPMGRPRGQSRSPDSDSDKKHIKGKDFKGKPREGKGKDGEGDHVIPYSAIEQALFSIIEDTDASEIPSHLNAISNALGLGDICDDNPETRQIFAQIADLRFERKLITQRIRGIRLAKEDLNNTATSQGLDAITNISELFDITIKEQFKGILEGKEADTIGRATDLLDLASNIEEAKLENIKTALHTIETDLSRTILIPIARDFLKGLNTRPGVKNQKERVAEQRKSREDSAKGVVTFLVDQSLILARKSSQTDSDHRLDAIDFLKKCNPQQKQQIATHFEIPTQNLDQV